MNTERVIKLLPLIILGILSILLMSGRVRFGFGLGDILYHGLIYIGFLIYLIYFFVKKEKSQKIGLVFPMASIIFCIYLMLTMTIWRGPEYSWNGYILVPIQKNKNKIINGLTTQKKYYG